MWPWLLVGLTAGPPDDIDTTTPPELWLCARYDPELDLTAREPGESE